MLLPNNVKCLLYDLDIKFNPHEQTFSNSDGISLRAKDFGGIKGIQ
jgi:hypothetical protein